MKALFVSCVRGSKFFVVITAEVVPWPVFSSRGSLEPPLRAMDTAQQVYIRRSTIIIIIITNNIIIREGLLI